MACHGNSCIYKLMLIIDLPISNIHFHEAILFCYFKMGNTKNRKRKAKISAENLEFLKNSKTSRSNSDRKLNSKDEGVTYQSGISYVTTGGRKCRKCRKVLKGSGHKKGQPCPIA